MKSNRSGYSLLEVLVAFTIMVMVLTVLLPGQARLVSLANSHYDQIWATELTLSRLDEAGISRPVELGSKQETYNDWILDWEISEVSHPTNDKAELARIVVIVRNAAGLELARAEALRSIP